MNKAIEDIHWWHQVRLSDGRITPGQVAVYQKEADYLFNELDFKGKSVLDVGCWDGYFSFMAEKRGAKRVLALDDPTFRWGGLDGFQWLHEHFQSTVEWRKGTVFQLPEETFDIVLCFGVLYHLSEPLLAAINCFQRARELVVLEGLMFEERQPFLRLLEPPFHNDPSNIYTMSTGYLEMVGRLNGFKLERHVQTAPHLGAMRFRVENKSSPIYVATCFPFPPARAT